MQIKPGVRIYGIQPELAIALMIAKDVYHEHDEQDRFVLTSVADGKHARGSLHYVGQAVDLRRPLVSPGSITESLKYRLGADFDVVLEKSHIHLEFQPKEPY